MNLEGVQDDVDVKALVRHLTPSEIEEIGFEAVLHCHGRMVDLWVKRALSLLVNSAESKRMS